MKVIIVDDESFAIEALEYVLEDMAGVGWQAPSRTPRRRWIL